MGSHCYDINFINIRLYKYISIDLGVVYKIACHGASSPWSAGCIQGRPAQTDLDILFIKGER
jgi:hypothetical protein